MHRFGVVSAIVSCAVLFAASAASAQTVTFSAQLSDGDGVIRAGETIRVDLFASWDPPQVGLAGVFFDLLDEGNLDDGQIRFDESAGLGRPLALRFNGGTGSLGDAEGDGDTDIVGIECYQQSPLFNPGFEASNPVRIYSFEWTAPQVRFDEYTVALSIDVMPPWPQIWEDDFFTDPYSAAPLLVEWDVLPPPDPLDLNDDGVNNVVDLGVLLGALGSNNTELRYNFRADHDDSGDIGFSDLQYQRVFLASGCPNVDPDGLDEATFVELVAVDNSAVGAGDDPEATTFDGGETHHTFDLRVNLPANTDWTACSAEAVLTRSNVTFFEHPAAVQSGFSPVAAEAAFRPALAFDTFFSAGSQVGAPAGVARFPAFVANREILPTRVCATWYDTSMTEAQTVTIARYTVVTNGSISGLVGRVSGVITTAGITSTARQFEVDIRVP